MIPRRMLPPNALVIALSPLLDQRSVGALLDLRARGYDLAVVDVSPVPFVARPPAGLDAVAHDIWVLRRDALRHRLQRAGVAVVEWTRGETAAIRRGGGAGIQALRPARARLITALLALVALGASGRVRGRHRTDGSRRSHSAWARSASRCSRVAIVLRWPTLVPWAIFVTAGRRTSAAGRASDVVDGWAAAIGVLLLLAAELAMWSIEHDARIPEERSLTRAASHDAWASSAAPRC